MKKLGLLLVIMIAFLMLPFSVLADKSSSSSNDVESNEEVEDDSEESDTGKEVRVYFFHGDGCPHCADAEEFFDSIEDEYGDLFEIVAYETWYDADNAALLEKVAAARDEDISGVPYIIIGNKSWAGYLSDFDDEIIEAIEEEYEVAVSDRYDIMNLVSFDDDDSTANKSYSDDVMSLIVILIIGVAVVTGVVFARKKTA